MVGFFRHEVHISLMIVLGTVVATILNIIGSEFKQSHRASYIGTSYLLSSCCFMPLYGRLSDILGRKVSYRRPSLVKYTKATREQWYPIDSNYRDPFNFCSSF